MGDADPPTTSASAPILAMATAAKLAPPVVLDTVVLIVLRVVYFLVARRYLLATLSPTLHELQKTGTDLPSLPIATHQRPARASGEASSSRDVRTPPRSFYPLPSDDEYTDDTPASSFPPSPARGSSASALLAGGADTPPGDASTPIEMNVLGAKLRDHQAAQCGRDTGPRVIELEHARSSDTRNTKRTARELSRAARILFSVCFAEGMNLLTLVAFHALGVLHAHARRVNFSVSLHILLALVLLVVPLVQCLLLTYRSRQPFASSSRKQLSLTTRLLIALIPFSVYIFLFTRIPPYITAVPLAATTTTASPDGTDTPADTGGIDDTTVQWSTGTEGWEGGGWLAPSLGRVVVLGVVVIGALSGMGAVITAWDYLEHAVGKRRAVTDADVLAAERSLYRVRHDAMNRRDEIERLRGTRTEERSWMSRVFGTQADQEASSAAAELRGLELMEADIARSLAALKRRRRAGRYQHTLRGSIYNALGYVFAIYCAARLVMCAVSLFFPAAPSHAHNPAGGDAEDKSGGNGYGDWISFVLALALAHLDTDADVASLSRTLSLLFTGALVVSSLAMVLRWLSRVLRLTSRRVGAGFLLLTLGQLFATYVVSLLVQLRSNLPPSQEAVGNGGVAGADLDSTAGHNGTESATGTPTAVPTASATDGVAAAAWGAVTAAAATADDSLLSSLPDFRVFGRLFDAAFLIAALGAGVFRYVATRSDDSKVYAALGR